MAATESYGVHGSGGWPSATNSEGSAFFAVASLMKRLTPSAYACSVSFIAGSARSNCAMISWRVYMSRRTAMSLASCPAPATCAEVPYPTLRRTSIWNRRSRACT
jgi:hypothetical protein